MSAANHPADDTTRAWLQALYGATDDGWVSLFSLDRRNGDRHVDWARVDDLDTLAERAQQRAATSCVWFGVAPRHSNLGTLRGGKDDCLTIPALWVDVDVATGTHKRTDLPPTIDDAHHLIADMPIPATATVHTGGGLQAWWLLAEPLDAAHANPLLERWGATWAELGRRRGWHVDNVFELARVMRLPGTVNRKSHPQPVTVLDADWRRRYGPDDLEQWTIAPPAPPEPETRRRVPYIGPERPGDAFNAVRRGGDLLNLAGFHLHHRDRNGDEHWTGPWKDRREGASATAYSDGHTTIWSDTAAEHWPTIEIRRPYDPFGLYTHLFHRGDWRAASDRLAAEGYGTKAMSDDVLAWLTQNTTPQPAAPTPQTTTSVEEAAVAQRRADLLEQLIRWDAFWSHDHGAGEWVAWPLIPAGRQTALYAPAKTGKSILTLAVVTAVATGRPILGDTPTAPRSVLYLDYEMTEADLYERLEALGYGPDVDMSRFHYALLPSLPPLNTREGCAAVVELAALVAADVVVIDTMGRAVDGEENDADTYRDFARLTGLALKAAGRAVLRTDHAGKEKDRGQRGSSAKNDDVDVVLRLDTIESGFLLTRTHSRISWVPDRVVITRVEVDDVVAYKADKGRSKTYLPGTKDLAAELDAIDLPLDVSQREASDAARKAGIQASNKRLRDAIAWRVAEATYLLVEGDESAPRFAGAVPFASQLQAPGRGDDTEDKSPGQGVGRAPGRGGARRARLDPVNGARCASIKEAQRPTPAPQTATSHLFDPPEDECDNPQPEHPTTEDDQP